jgi:hypothetical protein
MAYKVMVENLNERDHLENLVVDGSIKILKCIPQKYDSVFGLASSGSANISFSTRSHFSGGI